MYVIYFDVLEVDGWAHLSVEVPAEGDVKLAQSVWDRLKVGGFVMVSARP